MCVLLVVLGALVDGLRAPPADAHAALRSSDPAAGAVVDVAPTTVQLSFYEQPEPSLAVIRVSGAPGTSYATGPPEAVPGDGSTLAVPVQLPDRRVYTVTWQVVSATDGHPTSGAFAFGVGVPAPPEAAFTTTTDTSPLSPLEVLGRWYFFLGLIAVLGAATASLFGYTGTTGPASPLLGGAGLASAWFGLVVLGEAQRRAAGASWGPFLGTSIGHALAWRGFALGVVVAGWLLGRSRRPSVARPAAWLTVAAGGAAIAVHVAAGHAGARGSFRTASVVAQWGHVVAVCVWAGGLVALLLGVRGAPSRTKAELVRRFSRVAAPVLGIVVVTGVVRSFSTVPTWGDLASTGYGRAVLVKLALFAGIVGLATVNRRRAVPVAATTLRLLRRISGAELVLAATALAAAALIASLPPPSALREVEAPGLTASGADAALTVRVRLTTSTDAPGPNRFTVRVTDYESGRAAPADQVRLRFTPLDDPSVPPTLLTLEPGPDKTFEAAGTNLSLDGHWAITAVVAMGPTYTSVRLDVQVRGAPQSVSVVRVPGEPTTYVVDLASGEVLRVWADPEQAGPTRVYATFLDRLGGMLPMGDPVLLVGSGPSARQVLVQRLGPGQFAADVTLDPGVTVVAVVARTVEGNQRLRGTVALELPGG